jgi:hypothetical protein
MAYFDADKQAWVNDYDANATPATGTTGGVQGLTEPGNIDLSRRPVVRNPDGAISTVRSIGVNLDGKEVLIPTVAADGSRVLSDREAIQQFQKTGQHLGKFDTPDASTAYAKNLHNDQAKMYAPTAQAGAPNQIEQAAQMSDNDLALLASIRRTPGAPGVTQEQLQQQATQGTALPQAVSSTISGANEAAYGDIQKIEEARIEAAHQQSIAEKLQANANLDNAQAASITARQNADAATAEQEKREAEWQQKWDQLQQQTSPENNQVDPNRFFSRAGVLGSILAVVGSIYEAKGAALGHTQNPQTVMRLIDNDIRTQQLELMQKGQAANNQLSRLSQQWGSIDAGRQALKVSQLQATEAELRNVAAQTSDPARKAQIDAQTAALDAQTAAESAKLKAIYGGQQTATQQSAVVYPRKATGGGTSVDYGKYLANREKLAEGDRAERKLNQEKGGTGEQSEAGRAERLGMRLAELQQVLAAADAYHESVGTKLNPKTGEYEQADDHPLFGPVDTTVNAMTPESWHADKAITAEAKLAIAKEALGRAASGAAISDAENANFQRQLAASSERGSPKAAQALRAALLTKIQTLRAGAGQGATGIYDRNVREEALRQRSIDSVQPYQPKVGK